MTESPPTTPQRPLAPFVLSLVIAMLATTASVGGLVIDDLYRDNTLVTAAWRGNDLVTLVVAVPALLTSVIYTRRGSVRAELVWLGMLAYTLYGYAFYLFGAAFNRFFLLYVALFALSVLALVFSLPNLDLQRIRQTGVQVRTKQVQTKIVAGYMMLIAVGLGVAWTAMSLSFVLTGKLPPPIVATDHPTGVVFALDLSLLVPWFGLGAIWLWKNQPWGYALGVILNVKGATYTLALAVASLFAHRAGVEGASSEIALWLSLTAASMLAAATLLGRLTPA